MISEQAKAGFEYLLKEAIKDNLIASPDDSCEIDAIADVKSITGNEMVVLTISSYLFRLITFFYFSKNKETKGHFARKVGAQAKDLGESQFYDTVSEFGNIYCGALNRDLNKYFPHVGMSTPNILEKHCVAYMGALGGGFVRHFKISVNGSVDFHASLCVCDHADLNFVVDTKVVDDSTGELELF